VAECLQPISAVTETNAESNRISSAVTVTKTEPIAVVFSVFLFIILRCQSYSRPGIYDLLYLIIVDKLLSRPKFIDSVYIKMYCRLTTEIEKNTVIELYNFGHNQNCAQTVLLIGFGAVTETKHWSPSTVMTAFI
jgi:hypothetical protein